MGDCGGTRRDKEGNGVKLLIWFYFVIFINLFVGLSTYFLAKRDRKKRIKEYQNWHDKEIDRIRQEFDL